MIKLLPKDHQERRGLRRAHPWRRVFALVGALLLVIVIPSVLVVYFHPGKAQAAWFDNNWGFRQRIDTTVTSSASDISNLETLITVNTSALISASKLQSSCQDLRFTNVNGKVLNYYIDSGCNTTTTKIWVMADLVPKNTTVYTLYMYYGNTLAAAGSNAHYFDNVVGLVGYWTFNDASSGSSTTVTDSSVNANTGTWNGTLGSQWTSSGQYSNAGVFNGTDNFVTKSNPTNIPAGQAARTISAWIKPTATSPGGAIVSYGTGSAQEFIVQLATSGSVFIFTDGANGANNITITGSQIPTLNQWNHIVFTFDGGNAWNYYLNGVLAKSGTFGVTINTASPTTLNIGKRTDANSPTFFPGQIDDVKIYNTARTAQQVAADFANTSCGGLTCTIATSAVGTSGPSTSFATEEVGAAPTLYWKFDDISAGKGQALDSSSNANTGTLGGTTLPTWQTEDQCVSGKCVYFDGQSSVVTGSKVASNIQTLSFWIRPTNTNNIGILNLDGGTHKINTNATGVISAIGFTSPTYYINGYQTTTPTLIAGAWNYVEITTATSFNSTSSFTLGTDGTAFTNGYVDEVKFFNYVRTATQDLVDFNITANRIASLKPSTWNANLIASWPLDDTLKTTNAATTGTASAGGSTTLTDSSQTWITNSFANMQVVITNGTGSGQTRTVSSNTATVLTVSNAWTTNPDSTSQYAIMPNLSYSRTVSKYTSIGRNKINDGDMEASGTGSWVAINATLSKDTSSPHGGTQSLKILGPGSGSNPTAYQNSGTILGKVYTITGFAKGDGTNFPIVQNFQGSTLFTGTSSTSWQPFSVTFIEDGNDAIEFQANSNTGYVEFDDVSLNELNIPSSGNPTSIIADGNMETSGTSSWTAGNSATLTKQTGTPHGGTQVLRIARNGVSTPYSSQVVLTVGQVYRAYGYTRSDGNATPKIFTNGTTTTLFTGNTSTAWQPFDFLFIATATDINLGTNTNTGTQYVEYDDVTIAPDNAVRPDQILQDANMEASGTSSWTPNLAAVVTKQTSSPHSGTQVLRVANGGNANPYVTQAVLTYGKTYHIQGYVRSDGNGTPEIGYSSFALVQGTLSTSWQFIDKTFIASITSGYSSNGTTIYLMARNTSSSGQYVEFDDFTINEVDPFSGLPTNGVVLGAAAGGHLTNAYSFDGVNDNVDISSGTPASGSLNGAFSPSEGTLVAWAKVSGAGVWTDATKRVIATIVTDGGNTISIYRTTTNNQLQFDYIAGGTTKSITDTSLGGNTNFNQLVLTWSKSNGQVKAYINGAQVGSTQTSPGTWAGRLTGAAIGAATNSGTNPWSGLINDVSLYNRALTSQEIAQQYNGVATATGPVGWWKMDERTGSSAFDSSGNGNTGTLISSPTWVTGKYGSALKFNGTSNYVNAGNTSVLNFDATNAYTLEAWVKTSSVSNSPEIISKNLSTSPLTGYQFWLTTSGYPDFQLHGTSGANYLDAQTQTNVADGNWHHLVVTYNGTSNTSGVLFYIDGVLKTTTTTLNTLATSTVSSAPFNIASFANTTSEVFNGTIDDVRIYNYARTQAQIQQDMQGSPNAITNSGGSTNTTQPAAPVGQWRFDDGFGTTANNDGSGGSALNGTLTNMASPATTTSGWQNTGCKSNKCLAFDGTNDFVNVPDNAAIEFDRTNAFSTSFWAKGTNTSQGTIIGKLSGSQAGNPGWEITSNTDNNFNAAANKIGFHLINTSGGANMINAGTTNTTKINDGNWHHYVLTYDGSSAFTGLKLYEDGQSLPLSVGTANNLSASILNSQPLTIGSRASGTLPFAGFIDEPKLFPYALTADQVRNDYNLGSSVNYSTGTVEAANLPSGAGSAPVADWEFEERTGTTVNDTSGQGNTGTWNGTGTKHWVTGKVGAAGNFNGVDDYVSVPASNSINPTSAITLSLWINPSVTLNASTTRKDIMYKLTDYFMIHNFSVADGAMSFIFVGGGANRIVKSTTTSWAANTWYHIEGTYDGTTIKMYVNGKLENSTSYSGSLDGNNTTLNIGASTNPSNFFPGRIDSVKIYNYARSADQIAYDYNRGAPIARWRFDECQGTVANDSSGNGNTGTITIGASGTQTAAGTCNTSGTAWGNGATGKYNSSLNFDGTDDYVDAGTSSIFNITGAKTLSLWFKTSSSANTDMRLISKRMAVGGADPTTGYELYFNPSTGLLTYAHIAIGIATTTISNFSGNWTHVVASYDGTNARLYVNGILRSTTALASSSSNTNTLLIGRSGNSNTVDFSGQIDDVRVYNYALTTAQVQLLYNNNSAAAYEPVTGSP